LTASGLESGDHAEVFTLEAIEPLFKALADYANHRPEDGGNAVVRNVRLFRLLYGVSNRCLTGARALLKPDFEKMLWLGGGGLSMQELDMLKIAWSSVLTDSDMKKET
jgi:flavin-dependent dehydrogenase